jgi:hypothetical protein
MENLRRRGRRPGQRAGQVGGRGGRSAGGGAGQVVKGVRGVHMYKAENFNSYKQKFRKGSRIAILEPVRE